MSQTINLGARPGAAEDGVGMTAQDLDDLAAKWAAEPEHDEREERGHVYAALCKAFPRGWTPEIEAAAETVRDYLIALGWKPPRKDNSR